MKSRVWDFDNCKVLWDLIFHSKKFLELKNNNKVIQKKGSRLERHFALVRTFGNCLLGAPQKQKICFSTVRHRESPGTIELTNDSVSRAASGIISSRPCPVSMAAARVCSAANKAESSVIRGLACIEPPGAGVARDTHIDGPGLWFPCLARGV